MIMSSRYFGKTNGWTIGALLLVLSSATLSKASDLVLPGWDLFLTAPPTVFGGVAFEGVPIDTYDFGAGLQNVGNTDTIVQRLDPASAPSTAIPTELVALQLQSSVPADFGGGLDTYFITLQSARGGPASVGRMTINFDPAGEVIPHGTFDSFFDVFFDVRKGDLNGPIFLSDSLRLASQGTPWNHDPPPDAVLINGVNYHLNGSDKDNDFFPIGPVQEFHPTGAIHSVVPGTLPEASSTALTLALGLFGISLLGRFLKG
jgi:hypothetical protein